MAIEKPQSIAANPFKSAKWDEITAGRSFSQSDAPSLMLLCQWHAVAAEFWGDPMPWQRHVLDVVMQRDANDDFVNLTALVAPAAVRIALAAPVTCVFLVPVAQRPRRGGRILIPQ